MQDILTDELSREPVNECLGFSKTGLKQRYSKRFLEDKLQEGLSMVAKHENRVVGFALGYVHSLEKYGAGLLSANGEPLQAIRTICLEKMRELMPNERCVFFNHMVILKSYEGYGLGELFTKEWLGLIGRKGFKVVFGIALTKLVKAKLLVVSEVHKTINYKDFELNGQKPFEPLGEQHEGATLLVIRL